MLSLVIIIISITLWGFEGIFKLKLQAILFMPKQIFYIFYRKSREPIQSIKCVFLNPILYVLMFESSKFRIQFRVLSEFMFEVFRTHWPVVWIQWLVMPSRQFASSNSQEQQANVIKMFLRIKLKLFGFQKFHIGNIRKVINVKHFFLIYSISFTWNLDKIALIIGAYVLTTLIILVYKIDREFVLVCMICRRDAKVLHIDINTHCNILK